MARPKKNNAEYFSHDAGMRNHRKIKALRSKFGHVGYAVWLMTLEYLTDCEGNKFINSEEEIELLSGDFGVTPEEVRGVLDFCVKMKLLFSENGFYYSKSLNERLAVVYEKRVKAQEQAKDQPRINGRFCSNNTGEPDVSVAETPQSKVKEIKGFIEIGQKQNNYLIILGKYAKEKHRKVYSLEEYFHSTNQLENLELAGWTNFAAFMSENPGRMFNDDLHLYNTFKDFSGKFLPPPRAPTEFINAEVDKANLTLDAWENMYAYDLKHNEKFKNHFGYNGKLSPSQPVGSNDKR